MKFLQTKIIHNDHDNTGKVYVLTQGAGDDVAVYWDEFDARMLGMQSLDMTESMVGRRGHKLTEGEAVKFFTIPTGLHYRP